VHESDSYKYSSSEGIGDSKNIRRILKLLALDRDEPHDQGLKEGYDDEYELCPVVLIPHLFII